MLRYIKLIPTVLQTLPSCFKIATFYFLCGINSILHTLPWPQHHFLIFLTAHNSVLEQNISSWVFYLQSKAQLAVFKAESIITVTQNAFIYLKTKTNLIQKFDRFYFPVIFSLKQFQTCSFYFRVLYHSSIIQISSSLYCILMNVKISKFYFLLHGSSLLRVALYCLSHLSLTELSLLLCSHNLHNDVLINNELHITQQSHKIIMLLKDFYYLVKLQPLRCCSTMHYSCVYVDGGINKPTVLPVIQKYSAHNYAQYNYT